MSDEETLEETTETVMSAEYKDGQLQIVEVTPYDKGDGMQQILNSDEMPEHQHRYVQVVTEDKSVMQLDLLNMTIVRCGDGSNSYKLIANADSSSNSEISTEAVTCVLQQSSDTEDPDNQDSYVVMNGEDGPLMLLQSQLPKATHMHAEKKPDPKKKLTPVEILEKAKALQKAKALLAQSQMTKVGSRGRKRKSDLPPPHELLTSPNFKLFLYNCKMCSFKCNAIKEMTEHKAQEHAGGSRSRSGSSRSPVPLQCARCIYKGTTHMQLMKHVQQHHKYSDNENNVVILSSKRVQEAHVLVCGACGYESSSRQDFKKHIKEEHGASSC